MSIFFQNISVHFYIAYYKLSVFSPCPAELFIGLVHLPFFFKQSIIFFEYIRIRLVSQQYRELCCSILIGNRLDTSSVMINVSLNYVCQVFKFCYRCRFPQRLVNILLIKIIRCPISMLRI